LVFIIINIGAPGKAENLAGWKFSGKLRALGDLLPLLGSARLRSAVSEAEYPMIDPLIAEQKPCCRWMALELSNVCFPWMHAP
jgi:hypothetical protein